MLSIHWLLFLHSAVRLIPNHLNWVEFGGLWRPGHLMQHSITLLLGKLSLIQPGGVLGHCRVEKQLIVPLTPLRPNLWIYFHLIATEPISCVVTR